MLPLALSRNFFHALAHLLYLSLRTLPSVAQHGRTHGHQRDPRDGLHPPHHRLHGQHPRHGRATLHRLRMQPRPWQALRVGIVLFFHGRGEWRRRGRRRGRGRRGREQCVMMCGSLGLSHIALLTQHTTPTPHTPHTTYHTTHNTHTHTEFLVLNQYIAHAPRAQTSLPFTHTHPGVGAGSLRPTYHPSQLPHCTAS